MKTNVQWCKCIFSESPSLFLCSWTTPTHYQRHMSNEKEREREREGRCTLFVASLLCLRSEPHAKKCECACVPDVVVGVCACGVGVLFWLSFVAVYSATCWFSALSHHFLLPLIIKSAANFTIQLRIIAIYAKLCWYRDWNKALCFVHAYCSKFGSQHVVDGVKTC